jgi:cell division protein ZapB
MKHMQNQPLLLDAACKLPDIPAVETEFNSLEAKVSQFVSLCERLREENHDLRQQLAAAKSDAKRLNEKIDGAKARLEGLLSRLPG